MALVGTRTSYVPQDDRMVISSAVASVLPSGENAAARTLSVWPRRVATAAASRIGCVPQKTWRSHPPVASSSYLERRQGLPPCRNDE